MTILVDDKPYQAENDPGMTVGHLAGEVCRAHGGRRFVVALRCDEQPVPSDTLDSVLGRSISEFDQLELQTQPVANLVHAALEQAVIVFEDALPLRQQAAELLSEGRSEPAMDAFQKLLTTWRQVQETMVASVQALAINLDSVRVEGQGVADILAEIKPRLEELKDAMENGDHVVVSDVLAYDLEAPFARWMQLLCHLRDEAGAETE